MVQIVRSHTDVRKKEMYIDRKDLDRFEHKALPNKMQSVVKNIEFCTQVGRKSQMHGDKVSGA